ncbi:hypothetical protein BIY24_14365 [Halobacteriovorax marinus]|uniref:hypothetical protein n=1 Tax=Halobacteriovorax marinus TaxID=97084 RepID=UPI000BC34B6A|nr:hypothetical protein [Halobacteriovorax marinus]ATH09084.1 hypothetical protein BIY24_14365 [Halobacteriovorax marinus]
MNSSEILKIIEQFNETTHGSSDYDKDEFFLRGENSSSFAPLKYVQKKLDGLGGVGALLKQGFVCDSLELFELENFSNWYEKQFSKKLKRGQGKDISILGLPDNKSILDAVETVNKCYRILTEQQILVNGKKLPVQLGEWYSKCIFGLHQKKSTSQRGFDFYLDKKRVEVKVHWGDHSSPKGVKVRKSLVELSEFCVIIYVAKNFMIREVCFLDSEFIKRKFSGKGHTIFLKDVDISPYFFSKSDKHTDKVVNVNALMKYSNPNLAMKLVDRFGG